MATSPTRTLNWSACYNVRDLGGLPTSNGGVTQWRAIVRSDIPTRLTAEGRQALLDYGLRTILDLREPSQIREEPSIFMAQQDDVSTPTYLNLPMETREPAVSALSGVARDRAEVYGIDADSQPHRRLDVLQVRIITDIG